LACREDSVARQAGLEPAGSGGLGRSLSLAWDRVGREAFVMLAGQALSALAGLLSVRLLTSYFPSEVYGLSWLYINSVTLASLLTAGTLGQAFSRFYHDDDAAGHLDNLLGLVWRLQLLITLAVSLLYLAAVAALGHGAGGERFAVWVMPGYFLFLSFLTLAQLVLNAGRQRAKRVLLTVLDAWLKPGGALLLGYLWHHDVNAFVLGYAATTALLGVLGMYYLNGFGGRPLLSLPLPEKEAIRPLVAYCLPLLAITVVSWVLALSDRYLLNWQLGAALTGTYVAAYQVGSALFQLLGGAFGPLVQPIIFRRGCRSLQAGGASISLCYRAFAWLSLPLLAFFLLVHRWMMIWLVAPSYWGGISAVLWVGLGTYMWILGNLGMDAFQVAKRNGPLVLLTAISALLNIGMNLLLDKRFGVVGAGMATFFAYSCYAGSIIYLGKKILPWVFPWGTFALVASLSAVAAIAGKTIHLVLFDGAYHLPSFFGVVLTFLASLCLAAWTLRNSIRGNLGAFAEPAGPGQPMTVPT
jgi:O-antigen/teichoic acid export membrane protein